MTREEKIICKQFLNDADKTHSCNEYKMLIALLEQEPTTKNDLGVDSIARQDIERYIEGFINEYTSEEELEFIKLELDGLKHLPSVTLQEPKKGEWLRMSDLSEQEDDRYKCSRCGNVIHHKNKMDLYTFNSWCGRCGSDNGRHINYEVEE